MAPKTLIDTRVDRAAGGAIANRLRSGLIAGSEQHVALAVAMAGASALAALSIAVGHEPAPRGDDLIYERMASDPLGAHTFPFAYRIAVPWLVHASPLSHTLSFELLAWLSAGGAAGFAYLLMRRTGAARSVASALALMLALSPAMLIVGLRAGRNPDAATMLFLMAGTLFALERRSRALAVTLALGVLVREAELFLIPLTYALWAERWWDSSAARRALAVGAPALLIYISLRTAIPTVGGAQVPGYGGPLLASRLSLLGTGIGDGLVEARRMLSVYGPLWIAAPLALGGMAFSRRGLVLVAACVLAMTFALDWGRMIFLAAPVFYPAGAYTLTRHPRWRIPALATFAVLIAAYAIHMRGGGLRAGITEAPPPPYPVR
ncbi:MAG TPA: hypothetical protein VGI76_07255 [Solirubrobacteraceae bacterium]